jgi:hypothetical protein
LEEEYTLRVFENKVLRRIFGPKREEDGSRSTDFAFLESKGGRKEGKKQTNKETKKQRNRGPRKGQVEVFWVVTLCNVVVGCQRF